jgi:hypothetical protein
MTSNSRATLELKIKELKKKNYDFVEKKLKDLIVD